MLFHVALVAFLFAVGSTHDGLGSHGYIPVHFQPLSKDIIDYINSIDTTWKAGRNLEGVTTQYLKGLLGVAEDPNGFQLPGL